MTGDTQDTGKELEFHLEMLTRRYVEEGLDPDAARAKALARMGDLKAAERETQAILQRVETTTNRMSWVKLVAQDLHHAIRVLRRSPGYVAITIAMIALGTGASAAVFSVVDGVILRSPFVDVDSVAYLRARTPDGKLTSAVPRDAYDQLAAAPPAGVAALGLVGTASPIATGIDTPRRTQLECLSASMAQVLGTRPVMGRWFEAADDRPGAEGVALVSAKFWHGALGSDPHVLGRTIVLDQAPATIIGVMPAGFEGPYSRVGLDIWVPLGQSVAGAERFGCNASGRSVNALVRLQSDATMDMVSTVLGAAGSHGLAVTPLTEGTTADLEGPFSALVGAVLAVLLIAFANVANLGLERLVGRQRELAIRVALGASRSRIIRETVAEHLLVALTGAAVGIVLALALFDAIIALLPPSLPNLDAVAINVRVLAASLGLTVLGGLGAGVVSAVQASGTAVRGGITSGDRGHSRGSDLTKRALVVSELALGVLLLVGALLMIQTFLTLRPSAPGFDATGKQLALVRLPPNVSHRERLQFFDAVRRELAAVPGVQTVAGTTYVPMYGTRPLISLKAGDLQGEVIAGTVSPDYFDVMRIPLLRGRALHPADHAGAQAVAVVNDALVRRWLPAQEPLGAIVTLDGGGLSAVPVVIVGVIGDIRTSGNDTRVRPEIYLPFAQTMMGNPFFVVEADSRAAANLPATVRRIVSQTRPGQLVDRVESMTGMIGAKVATPRMGAWIFGGFAVLAVLLGAVGLAVTLAWSVAQRRREIGIRMALGAQARDVRKLVVQQTFWMSATGVGLGLAAAGASTELLAGWLYGVTPLDPLTFAGCGLLMLGVAAIAAYVPTRRATRVNPLIALRGD